MAKPDTQMNAPTISILEARIRKTLSSCIVSGARYSRLVRQLKLVSLYTGETLEQIAARLGGAA